MDSRYDVAGGEPFRIAGVEFVPGYLRRSQPGSFTLLKSPSMLEEYRALVQEFSGGRIFELGIAQGGSVALLALTLDPARLVSVDISPDPVAPLLQMIEARGLGDRVRPHFGVDQSDRVRLARIAQEEFGDRPLDLVIDDASHAYRPTLASFEVLFPRLRPGGRYVIEDWAWLHMVAQALHDVLEDRDDPRREGVVDLCATAAAQRDEEDVPLSRLGVEAMLARATTGGVVGDVTVTADWITITRGPAALDHDTFCLADHYRDHFGYLSAGSAPPSRS